MAEQALTLQATQAEPAAAAQLSLTSNEYHSLRGVRFAVDNDNASSSVSYTVVISRSSAPLSAGSVVDAKVIERRDPYVVTGTLAAGASDIRGRLDDLSIIQDEDQLLDEMTYVGVRAAGLESGKTFNLHLVVESEAFSKTSARDAQFLREALRFQQAG